MKIFATVLFLFFSVVTYCQDSIRVLSKFEKFSSEKGSMRKIESVKVGDAGDISISLQRITNLQSGDFRLALVLKQVKVALLTYIGTGYIYIDYDEIESVQKALNFYLEEIKNNKKPKNDPSYIYTTNNNVVVSCSNISSFFGAGWYVSLSLQYENSHLTIPNSTITIKNKEIDNLVDVFSKIKAVSF